MVIGVAAIAVASMRGLKDKTLFITGASRGIGLAIALRAAGEGANIIIAAKTDLPHPKLEGTIHTAADAIRKAGGRALAVRTDIRDEVQVREAVAAGAAAFGGIDMCINNASAIALGPTLETDMKRYDLMHDINGRGSFVVSRCCLPHLLAASGPAHILMISPPLNLVPQWFANHPAYTVSKYNMSLYALAFAEEFRGRLAVNALWPRTTIATAAIANLLGGETMMRRSRSPRIMADAACAILQKDLSFTGNFCIDDEVLTNEGISDLEQYRVDSTVELERDLFVADWGSPRRGAPL
jgi:citronellol/citronellal dehydrogenase